MSLLVQELFSAKVEISGSRLHVYGQANAGRRNMAGRIFGPGARNSPIKAYAPWVQGEDIVHCSLYMSSKGRRYQSIVSHLVYPIQGPGSKLHSI